jgi:hypothetical protein
MRWMRTREQQNWTPPTSTSRHASLCLGTVEAPEEMYTMHLYLRMCIHKHIRAASVCLLLYTTADRASKHLNNRLISHLLMLNA